MKEGRLGKRDKEISEEEVWCIGQFSFSLWNFLEG